MYTIVGLGNPGDEYKMTRHNIGWIALLSVVSRHTLPSLTKSAKYTGLLSEGMLGGRDVAILLPTTFMNNSGTAVVKYLREKGALEKLVVVHDDIDLPLGEVRIGFDRGAGGHNGVKSIIDACNSKAFIRVRIGIAQKGFFGGIKRPTGEKLSEFVLTEFKKGEQGTLTEIGEKVDRALTLIIERGVQYAMQEVNGK